MQRAWEKSFFEAMSCSDDGGFACLFATETQLNLLKASTDLFTVRFFN